ncbi:MAG: fadE 2, partial [Gammaproteobacteria bacterium]|nr:fadE 2 [Gammaproteobacteria bacterium]
MFILILVLLMVAGLVLILNYKSLRRLIVSKPLLYVYRRVMPHMSRTEKEALEAGSVWWEGELFSGKPDWEKLLAYPAPVLTAEEQAFLAGPTEELCRMTNDWQIVHQYKDLPPEIWEFIKIKKFMGIVIPKTYGGLGFSPYAFGRIVEKLFSCSVTLGSTVSVPNSLGPAELLLKYGTDAQKNYYLGRLATGEEIPCFALTGPEAGSDAGAMPDYGILCRGMHEGKEVLGIRLTFKKRYITLAPIATLIGLAFKLYDPDSLLGNKEDLGITCALIPRNMPGIEIGRRHYPAGNPFQNGPIAGKDVFIPIDWIIGGAPMAGYGWRMLMECLAAGRAVCLPGSGVAATKVAAQTAGAYGRLRKQFNLSIGYFEGVEEVLTRIAAKAYWTEAAYKFTLGALNSGEAPPIPSGILKYHATEAGRQAVIDAMDIQAGKAVILGPKNYLGNCYQGLPIAITVEGANILTRSMIIFGQGAMRCHPYVLKELQAAQEEEPKAALHQFDDDIFGHLRFTNRNFFTTLWLGLTSARLVKVAPVCNPKRYYQSLTRF